MSRYGANFTGPAYSKRYRAPKPLARFAHKVKGGRMEGRWSTWAEREPLLIRSEKGREVPASRRGSDAWLARQMVRWTRLAARIGKVER